MILSLIVALALFPANEAEKEDEWFTNCESLPV